MNHRALVFAAAAVLATSGCATWSTSSVDRAATASDSTTPTAESASKPATPTSQIKITEEDITDRKYKVLGDIEVTVNKTTLLHDSPTRTHVDEKLREEASDMGADAVILVRYGTVGISLWSWGSLEGRGRAVAFTN